MKSIAPKDVPYVTKMDLTNGIIINIRHMPIINAGNAINLRPQIDYHPVYLSRDLLSRHTEHTKIGVFYREERGLLVPADYSIILGGDGNFYIDEKFELSRFYALADMGHLQDAISVVNQDPILRRLVREGLFTTLSSYAREFKEEEIFGRLRLYDDMSLGY